MTCLQKSMYRIYVHNKFHFYTIENKVEKCVYVKCWEMVLSKIKENDKIRFTFLNIWHFIFIVLLCKFLKALSYSQFSLTNLFHKFGYNQYMFLLDTCVCKVISHNTKLIIKARINIDNELLTLSTISVLKT